MPENWKIKRQPKTLTEGDMKESDDEDEIVTLIRNRGLVRRAIETVAAAFVVVLFLLYPTLLKVTTKMLQCRELDFGAQANAKVLIADPSISCDDPRWRSTRSVAIVLMLVWGLGVPALSIAIINIIRRVTLHGHKDAARVLFFFMTGGFKPQHYYWEATTMGRKAVIIFIVVLIDDTRLRAYLCVWAMLAVLGLQTSVLPYSQPQLSRLETSSILTILITFSLLMAQSLFTMNGDPGVYWTITVLAYVVNILLFIVFAVTIGQSFRIFMSNLVHRKQFLAFLRPYFAEKTATGAELQSVTEDLRQKIDVLRSHCNNLERRAVLVEQAFEILAPYVHSDPEVSEILLDYRRIKRHSQLYLTHGSASQLAKKFEEIMTVEKRVVEKLLEKLKKKERPLVVTEAPPVIRSRYVQDVTQFFALDPDDPTNDQHVEWKQRRDYEDPEEELDLNW